MIKKLIIETIIFKGKKRDISMTKHSKENVFFNLPFMIKVKYIATPLTIKTKKIVHTIKMQIFVFVKWWQQLSLPLDGLESFFASSFTLVLTEYDSFSWYRSVGLASV